MIETVDEQWCQTPHLYFKDVGYVRPGARTRVFRVSSRQSGAELGEIKWYPHWRQYTFFPVNAIFDRHCLREVAEFCESKTMEHRGRNK